MMNVNKKFGVLIIIYVISYFVMTYVSMQNGLDIYTMFGLQQDLVCKYHEFYRILTYSFAHGDIMHLAFNMVALYSLVDAVISFTSEKATIIIYTISTLVSAIGVLLLSSAFTVGASGAIYGLFGVLIYYALKQRKYGYNDMFRSLLPVIVINLVLSFLPEVSMTGHLFGLATGLIGAYIYDKKSRQYY